MLSSKFIKFPLKTPNYSKNLACYLYIKGLRKKPFGVMLIDQNGTYLGMMELMPPATRKQLYSLLKSRIIDESEDFIQIEPIKCRVKYRNLTKNQLLRTPSFVEWV